MAFISDADRPLLEQRFREQLPSAVTLQLFTTPRYGLYVPGREECVTCADAEALLTEVADLSPQLTLTKHDLYAAAGVDKVPALVLRGAIPERQLVREVLRALPDSTAPDETP